MKNILYIILILAFASCKKQDEWLNAKSNKSDIVPSTLEDFQAILDNNTIMNTNYPAMGIIGSDNSYVTDLTATTAGAIYERNAYKWAADVYEGDLSSSDWGSAYKVIEYANIVLDGLQKINSDTQNQAQYNNVKGSAIFYRAIAFYQLVQIYAKPYNAVSANTDLGIPLRLSSDVNVVVQRSTLEETYQQIISDLISAENLLEISPIYKTRPSKTAAQLMLAKTYLLMGDYAKAKDFCNKVLNISNALIDFNSLNSTQTYPFPNFQANNAEVIFYSITFNYTFVFSTYMFVSPELYNTYTSDDLRKRMFFSTNADGTINFRGSYLGLRTIFAGLSTNEAYLILAECLVRTGQIAEGMKALDALLVKRWKKDSSGNTTYVNKTASNETEALTILLNERRKELPFNGNTRWEDLRRLNQDPRFVKTLTRTIAGAIYTLPPNDPRYVLPIPPSEMNIRPLIQNPR
jgi:tetratricopeptide (TPR) repeat protein